MGKRSNGGKKGKKSAEGAKKPLHDKVPELPVEIFSVFAEFLIGQHAFGSTANLNLVSRAVHLETLPVLYETVLIMRPERLACFSGAVGPTGFRYTKYAFYSSMNEQPFQFQMPNIVFTINLSLGNIHGDACTLTLTKSVSAATVITILKTPVAYLAVDHYPCAVINGGQISRQCVEEDSKPYFRPVRAIGSIMKENAGVHLHANPPVHLRNIATEPILYNTEMKNIHGQTLVDDYGNVHTASPTPGRQRVRG